MIQYPVAYSNYNALQRPIVCNSNLVKNNVYATIKQGENSNKQKAKEMQSRWCPSGLSHTKKKEVGKTMQVRSNRAANRREASQVNTDQEGVGTEAGVIFDLSKTCVRPLFC
jgi:hypothetical protein